MEQPHQQYFGVDLEQPVDEDPEQPVDEDREQHAEEEDEEDVRYFLLFLPLSFVHLHFI